MNSGKMELRKVYEEAADGGMAHVNWCLYRDEFDCVREALSYANYLRTFKRRHLDTIRSKMTSLKYWYEFLGSGGLGLDDYITLQGQMDFVAFLDRQENRRKVRPVHLVGKGRYGKGFSALTTARHQANIYQYYQYLHDREKTALEPKDFPFKEIHTPAASDHKALPKTIGNSDVRRMIEACLSMRDKLVILLMVTVGLRLGEVAALTMDVINPATGTINMDEREYLDLETGTLKTGPRRLKGNRVLFSLLHRYRIFERDRVAISSNVLVNLSRRGGGVPGAPMTKDSIESLFKRLRRRTGIKNCHPHALRHTFATNFLRLREKNDKVSLAKLQKLLGHSDLRTTTIYTHLDYTDFDKAIGKDFEAFVAEAFGDFPETF